jgi:RND family efflux transporter MFP subunit
MIAWWWDTTLSASLRGGAALIIVWSLCLIPQLPSGVRCWLWRAGYAVVLMSFIWTTPINLPLKSAAAIPEYGFKDRPEPTSVVGLADRASVSSQHDTTDTVAAGASHLDMPRTKPAVRPTWPVIAFAAWMCFVTVYAARLFRNWCNAHRLGLGRPTEISGLLELCRMMNVGRPPRIVIHPAAQGPLLIGAIRPVIVLPESPLRAANLQLVLAHEMAHLKRRDLLWNWLPTIALALLPIHPIVWIGNRQWRLAVESACDAAAVTATSADPVAYSQVLIDVATGPRHRASGVVALAVMADSRWLLKKRLRMLKNIPRWNQRRLILAAMIVAVMFVMAAVPWRVVAQQPSAVLHPTTTAPTSRAHGPTEISADFKPPAAPDTQSDLHCIGTIVVNSDVIRLATNGTVSKVQVGVGHSFKRGDLLIQMDSTSADDDVAGAQAKVEYAQKAADEQSRRQKNGITTNLEADLTAAQLKLSQSELSRAMHAVEATRVVAPFDGVVASCQVQSGDVVERHEPLMTILRAGPPRVEFDLPQQYVGQVMPGTRVTVSTRHGDAAITAEGAVDFVSPMVDSATATQHVTAQLTAAQPNLLSGMFVEVDIHLSPATRSSAHQ